MRVVGLVVVWLAGGVAWAAPPSLLWEGKLVWTMPAAVPTLSSTLGLTWAAAGWEWTGKVAVEDGVWKNLTITGSGKVGHIELSPSLTFDPQVPRFRTLTIPWKLDFLGLAAEGVARLEEKGFGWGLTLLGPKDALFERVRLRFNLKRFLDEVIEDTFAPSFSFGEIRFQVALPCCVPRLRGWLLFTKQGFSEFGLSFPLPFPKETGLFFSGVIRFKTEEKRDFLAPGLIYTPPPCVEAFFGLDWDAQNWAIRGIKVYALGFRCKIGDVFVRALTMFEDIGLVKRPYWEALYVGWEGVGCCGPTKFWAALYFGNAGLFGLGEVETGVELAISPGFSLLLENRFPAGRAEMSVGWKISL